MPYETKRDHLEHINHLIHDYPKRPPGDTLKQYLELENALFCLDIYDFDLDANHDLWQEIKKGLEAYPLHNDGETLCKLRGREQEEKGHWWRNPRNWTTENKTERDELLEIINFLKDWSPKGDKWMVANYFHVLEELSRSENSDLWDMLKKISKENTALQLICWKRYAAWTKDYKDKWWWWKIGDDLCEE